MKLLFVMYHPGYVRNLESVIRALADDGHQLILGFNDSKEDGTAHLAERLTDRYESIKVCMLPNREDRWRLTATFVRRCVDFLRYHDPAFDDAPALKARVAERLPTFVRVIYTVLRVRQSASRRLWVHRLLMSMEAAIPTCRDIDAALGRIAPDAMVVTPLVDVDSKQVDWLKSAQAVPIPTCLAVYSWDNLTNKGHMRLVPDRVLLWNNAQREEAIEFHGVPASQIVVTGAQAYDRWFDRKPSIDRRSFLTGVGLDPEAPALLFLCSSPFISGATEPGFVRDWLTALRGSGVPALEAVGVIIRPHPQNAEVWKDVDLSEYGNVAIFPRAGANPVDEAQRSHYFHSLYFSAAVVGINTSAMIEAGIVGRPVLTIRDPRFQATQEGTLHFRHLTREGLVRVADSLAAGVGLCADALSGSFDDEGAASFLTTFVRPHGLAAPATPRVVEALAALPDVVPAPPRRHGLRNAVLGTLMAPAEWVGVLVARRWAQRSGR